MRERRWWPWAVIVLSAGSWGLFASLAYAPLWMPVIGMLPGIPPVNRLDSAAWLIAAAAVAWWAASDRSPSQQTWIRPLLLALPWTLITMGAFVTISDAIGVGYGIADAEQRSHSPFIWRYGLMPYSTLLVGGVWWLGFKIVLLRATPHAIRNRLLLACVAGGILVAQCVVSRSTSLLPILWGSTGAGAAGIAIGLYSLADEWHKRLEGHVHCGECGYPLYGLTGTTCPECGALIPQHRRGLSPPE